MKTIFIDESGDLGTKERYFVISLLIPQNNKRISNFIKKFCIKNNIGEVKASSLSFEQKQLLFNKLSTKNDYSVSYIVIDKSKILNHKIFCFKNLLFSYLSSLIIEKVVTNTDEDVSIIFDNRSVKIGSSSTLADYMKIKSYTQWNFQHNLNVTFADSKQSKLIQATDLIANAIYSKYNYGNEHFFNIIVNQIKYYIEYPI